MTVAAKINRPMVNFEDIHNLAAVISGSMYCGCHMLAQVYSPGQSDSLLHRSLTNHFILIGEQITQFNRKLRLLESLTDEQIKAAAKLSKPKQVKAIKAAA